MASKRSTTSSAAAASKKPRRQVSTATFRKWQRQFESQYQSLTWLRCDADGKDHELVDKLWCHLCRKHESAIHSSKNFSRAWIEGSNNHNTSNITDHATSHQHHAAIIREQAVVAKATQQPITSYSPIAASLMTMDDAVKKMKMKFNISYLLAKEGIAFKKYPALYELEARHGVNLGFAYKTKDSAIRPLYAILPGANESLFFTLSLLDLTSLVF